MILAAHAGALDATGADLRLEPRNLPDEIARALRDAILSGRRAPLSPLRQEALAAELGVSKIPVREALTQLERDGLVLALPNRGWRVAPLSHREAEEVFEVRLALEPDLTALASTLATRDEADLAAATLKRLNGESDRLAKSELNRSLHLALMRPAQRPLTLQILDRLHGLAQRYVHLQLDPDGRRARADAEHSELVRAWTNGEADRVRGLVRTHIAATLDDLSLQLDRGLGQDALEV